jgi:hypothetical protein
MAKARKQRLAVEHDRRIGREHEIRKVGLRIDELDCRAECEKGVVQRKPLLLGFLVKRAGAALPAFRVHPGIDAVAHRVVKRWTHQEAGFGRLARVQLRPRGPPVLGA